MSHVTVPVRIPEWVWKEFVAWARRRRRKPELLVEEAARDYVQRIADEDLLEASCRDAQRTGYREEDAVELVRQLRQKKLRQAGNGRTKRANARGR